MTKQSKIRNERPDAVIVGARCAGAATAMLLARQGLDVLVIERGQYGSDTLSTHALMRGAVMQLNRWGLADAVRESGAAAVTRTSFHYGEEQVEVRIKSDYGVDALFAPRRYVLDRILVDAARQAGAAFRFGCKVDGLTRSADGAVNGVIMRDENGMLSEITAGIVIGADGVRSTVAREAGAQMKVEGQFATAAVYGYFEGIANKGYRWGFGPELSSGVIPTNNGTSLVFTGVPSQKYRETFAGDVAGGFRRILEAQSYALADEVGQAKQTERLRGYAGKAGFIRQSHGPGWALVGDAAYYRDPVTAHGITDALRDADLLSRAVTAYEGFGFKDYQDLQNKLSRPLFDATDAIASFDWTYDEVKQHHLALNAAMKKEVATMAGLGPAPSFDKSRSAKFGAAKGVSSSAA